VTDETALDTKRGSSFDLDALHEPVPTANWLNISKRILLDGVRKGKIPVVRLNARTLRFHPRTILAKLTASAVR
jgi:hypothetical protein